MAAEQPADSFWDLLRQSGLVPDEQVRALEAELGGAGAKLQSSSAVADELTRRGVLTEWQADNLKRGKTRGFHLGPYRILRPLGQGGMSKVFLAEHELMHRRCAIKILPNKYQEDSELLGRFHLEAEAIAKLDHPHIVRAYDFNKDVRYGKDIHYLVMEYIDGQDLRQMVEQHGPLDYRQAADFIRQAAEGLAHAHTAGLVHRDVKPANLLVDRNGVLKILDLGLARFTFEGEQAWQTSEGEQSAVGTADYVAPEQVMDSRSVTGRADIYSLGLTFYFLLTGRRPFPKSTLPELLMAHKMERPEPIGKLRPDVPTDLVDIIERMTAKQPFMRFQSAKDVAEALQTWLHESESGREYSRISALMAAAMCAKQAPPSDAPAAKPAPAGSADLELVFLDDERKVAGAPAEAKPSESSRSAITRAAAAAAKTKERKSSTSDSSVRRAARLPDLLADDVISASSDPRLAVGTNQVSLPYASHPQFKHGGGADILKSPWPWIGLAGVILVVLLVLAISLVRGPQAAPGDHRSDKGRIESSEANSMGPGGPPAEPTTPPVNPTKLIAETKSFAYWSNAKPDGPLESIVHDQVVEATDQLRITVSEGKTGPNVMRINFSPAKVGNVTNMMISAEWTYTSPDGKPVIVWADTQQVPAISSATSQDHAMSMLREGLSNLLKRFADDVRKARAASAPK